VTFGATYNCRNNNGREYNRAKADPVTNTPAPMVELDILRSQDKYGWGAKIIDQLSRDLKSEFPESKGFSLRNLKYMRRFAEEYPAKLPT
jgi:hypothetical protein